MKPRIALLLTILAASLPLNHAGAQTDTSRPPIPSGPGDDAVKIAIEYSNEASNIKLFLNNFFLSLDRCPKSNLHFTKEEKNNPDLANVYFKLLVAETGQSKTTCEQATPSTEKKHNPTVKCIFKDVGLQKNLKDVIDNEYFNNYVKSKYPLIKDPDQIGKFFENFVSRELDHENKK